MDASSLVPQEQRLERSDTDRRFTLEHLDPSIRKNALADIDAGQHVKSIARKHSISEHTVIALKRERDEQVTVDLPTYKKAATANLTKFVALASDRLVREVERIPLTHLSVSTAIAIDKIDALQTHTAPVVAQHLHISIGSLDAAIRAAKEGRTPPVACPPPHNEPIDVTPSASTGVYETQ